MLERFRRRVAERDEAIAPERDPDRPQDDPWDADAVRYLLDAPGGSSWTRGNLMECLREQPKRVREQPDRVREAASLAHRHGVERKRYTDGRTLHFFRSDAAAPTYPQSDVERRAILRETSGH